MQLTVLPGENLDRRDSAWRQPKWSYSGQRLLIKKLNQANDRAKVRCRFCLSFEFMHYPVHVQVIKINLHVSYMYIHVHVVDLSVGIWFLWLFYQIIVVSCKAIDLHDTRVYMYSHVLKTRWNRFIAFYCFEANIAIAITSTNCATPFAQMDLVYGDCDSICSGKDFALWLKRFSITNIKRINWIKF